MSIENVLDVVSFSRLRIFSECPRRGYKHYILDIPEPASKEAVFGRLVHHILATCMKDRISPKEAVKTFDNAMLEILEESEKAEAIELAQQELDFFAIPDEGLLLEHHFSFPLEGTDCVIQGYIDRVWLKPDGTVIVTDYKTGFSDSNLEDYQLSFYALGLAHSFKIPMSLITREYRVLRMRKSIQDPVKNPYKALAWAKQIVEQIQTGIALLPFGEDIAFPKKPCESSCKHCGYRFECLNDKAINLPESIETLEDAQQTAREIFRMEILLKEAKARFEEYCLKTQQYVEVNGEYYGLYPGNVNKEYDMEALLGILQAAPATDKAGNTLNPLDVFNVDSRKLKAYIKAAGGPALESMVEKTIIRVKQNKPTLKRGKFPPEAPVSAGN